MPRGIEYADWLELADANGYILTPESYDRLTTGKSYRMVQLDYMNFLFQEGVYEMGKSYKPSDIYKEHIHVIKPTKVVTQRTGDTISRCCECHGIKEETSLITEYGLKSKTMGWNFYRANEEKWLTTGNGDSYSRWVLWSDIKRMPRVYYEDID